MFEKEEKSSSINITPQNLKSLISKTAFAMGNQDWRHYLNGLYLSIEDTQITSVATDAHRLALASLGLNEGVSDQITGIVPRKSINEIGKISIRSKWKCRVKNQRCLFRISCRKFGF